DKTGTLTGGRLEVTDVEPLGDATPAEMLSLAASVEARSEHPIGRAIAARHGVTAAVSEFRAHPGRGVTAMVEGRRVAIGTADFLAETGLAPEARAEAMRRLEPLERSGRTVVMVAWGARVVGLIGLADRPRPEAASVLRRLREDGVRHQVLLTGDQPFAAAAVGAEMGVDEVRDSLRPEDKVDAVRELGEEHGTVAMVGDGVNDAPALAAAQVGIAMGGAGSPASIATADVVLMGDDLGMLPYARRLTRTARRLVRVNIGLALGLKALLAVGAVTGHVSLIVAVLVGDMGATIAVVLNAMRLARVTY
ncbi:MAG: heavy metal translocating P-type ATPase, partial [Gemmatimonadota bacterium]